MIILVSMRQQITAVVVGATLVAGVRIVAHHSFAGVYDQSKPLRVEGIVETLEWKNPHVTLMLLTRDTDGTETHWSFEMGAPRILMQHFGWSPETVRVGDRITVEGFRARAGGAQAAAVRVTTRTGKRLDAVLPFR